LLPSGYIHVGVLVDDDVVVDAVAVAVDAGDGVAVAVGVDSV
jgi:hypothetical protein